MTQAVIQLRNRPAPAKARASRFVAMTNPKKGEAPAHHFFASSVGAWRVSYDLHGLIEDMKRDRLPFNVWLVPGQIDANYQIAFFAPQVEGSVWLAFYGKDE